MTTVTTYKDFQVKRRSKILELQATLIELEHEPTGAAVMHLACDDDENLFSLSFRTWPDSSNGVAHVLEHTVLCGSEKFPIRDPFFSMSRHSLNTFMNALTGADFTCYPAASQVPKDFYNILEVYLDAVFKPLLSKESFLQEGHRLEFLESDNPKTPLCIKGIVFNEMKGSLANPDTRLSEHMMEFLFPDLTYGVNSGGDPHVIPGLTHSQLKAFHAKFYHPSRCLFFFYGNLPLEDHLDFITKHALQGVEKLPPLPLLPRQPRLKEKVVRAFPYPIAEEEDLTDKTMVGMGFLTCSILDQEELLALEVIDLVLMGTDAAPLKMALLKSGLCKQTDSALEDEISEVPFLLVCKGCKQEDVDALEEVVRDTLKKMVASGFPSHLVEGAIHQLELSRYEITGNSSPYGLSLFFRSALLFQHGGNPEDGLAIHSLFKKLKDKIKDPHYLPSLVQRHFLDNPHFVRITLYPDTDLAARERAAEEEKTRLILESCSEETIQQILSQSKSLQACQESGDEEETAILPTVSLADVPQKGKEFALHQQQEGIWTLFHHSCFTNDILYADLVFDLPETAEEDLPYLRLFSLLLPQLGCGGRNYKDHLDYVLQHTGGVGVSMDLSLQIKDPSLMRPMLSLRGKCLHRKVDKLFPLFSDILQSADFTDKERLQELLMQHFHGLKNAIQSHSLRYAVNLAASGLSVPSRIINLWYGLEYYWKLKEIVDLFEKTPSLLIDKMQQMQQNYLCLQGGHLVLSCDDSIVSSLKKEAFFGLQELPTKAYPTWKGNFSLPSVESQGRLTSSPVAFTAMIFRSLAYHHPAAPLLSLASEIMENTTLHRKIREQGGAYGSGAVNALLSAHFYFYSYRDPNLSSTLDAFSESIDEIARGNFDEEDLVEAKLGIIQELDAPCAPSSRAMTAYSRWRSGRTAEQRQAFRMRILKASTDEVQKSVQEHLVKAIKSSTIVSFANKDLFEKENIALQTKALPLYALE